MLLLFFFLFGIRVHLVLWLIIRVNRVTAPVIRALILRVGLLLHILCIIVFQPLLLFVVSITSRLSFLFIVFIPSKSASVQDDVELSCIFFRRLILDSRFRL